MSECVRCTAPAAGMSLCSTCGIALRIELTDVPDLLANLDITRSRQDQLRLPFDHGPRDSEVPLPFRPHVSEVVWVLHHTLDSWATTLGQDTPGATTSDLALWLLGHLDLVRMCPEADQLADEVTAAIHQARRAIDRPDDRRLFLGPCGNKVPENTSGYTTGSVTCKEEVYGLPWNRTAICPGCGFEHNIERRQAWLRDKAQDYLGTATEIAGFLRGTGLRCTADMIRGYVNRRRLATAGVNGAGHTLYRISDVIAALQQRYQHRDAG